VPQRLRFRCLLRVIENAVRVGAGSAGARPSEPGVRFVGVDAEMQDRSWNEEGVLLFSPFRIANQRRTASGERRIHRQGNPLADLIRRWCGVLAVSPALWRLR